jgi:hypothetical protein
MLCVHVGSCTQGQCARWGLQDHTHLICAWFMRSMGWVHGVVHAGSCTQVDAQWEVRQ